MSYMSGLILRVADVDRFVAGWNDFGKQTFLDAGATSARISQSVFAGEDAGNIGIASEWDSIDVAIEAPAAILNIPESAEMMKSAGAEMLRRSLMRVQATRGSLEGKYGSLVVGTGDPATPEQMEANADAFWGHIQGGANGAMWAQAVAAGPMTGAYLTMSLSDSLDQLMTEGQKAFADPAIQQILASMNFQLTGRSLFKVLG
jgi:hypothetical protein